MSALPLVAGVLLTVIGGVVRVRAWFTALPATAPEVRYRDVVVAHLAGAGFNGLVPVHAGDAVKVALLKRRAPEAHLAALVGTLAPAAAIEALLTALLLVWALATGIVDPPSTGTIPLPLVGGAAVLAAGLLWLLARRAPRVLRDVRAGMAALRHPRALLARIVPWVVAARLIRLLAVMCFLLAAGLPATIGGALLVMAVQGSVGSSSPAGTPVRMAVLTASLPAALGIHAVSFETATMLIAALQLGPMIANLAISVVVVALTLRTTSPRRVLSFVTGR